ncbi:hypothetical protein LFM09_49025 [Lentzea alba]|uniref:hypothetical protein n=1 Tax=Lentzea alba TaxID=2714351 RepID=UPI0039BFEB02
MGGDPGSIERLTAHRDVGGIDATWLDEDVGLIDVCGRVGGMVVDVLGGFDAGGASRLDCGGVTVVGVGAVERGGVVGGTGEVVEGTEVVEDGDTAGSGGVADGSTASATATTPTVASPLPTTAMVRRRDRTAWPRWIRSAAVTARGGASSPCRAEKVARRSSSRTITPPA